MRLKHSIGWILILIMLFVTGCGKEKNAKIENPSNQSIEQDDTENEVKQTGHYIAKDVNFFLDEYANVYDVTRNANDQVEWFYYDYDFEKDRMRFNNINTVDGKLEMCEMLEFEKARETWQIAPFELIYGNDSNYYMLSQGYNKTLDDDPTDDKYPESQNILFQLDHESKDFVSVTPDLWMPGNEFAWKTIEDIEVSKSGILCYKVYQGNEIFFYDLNNQEELYLDSFETKQAFTVKEDQLYYIPNSKNSVICYDFNTNERTEYTAGFGSTIYGIQVGDQGNIYVMDTNGIHVLRSNGTMWETIVDKSVCGIDGDVQTFCRFVLIPGEYDSFYILYYSKVDYQRVAKQFVYSENDADATQTELSIYSLWENKAISKAIREYMCAHPEVKIEYRVLNEDGTMLPINDMIHGINTELLSGKGADLIVLDNLPMEDYIQKGVLMDISDLFQGMMDDKTLIPSIAQNYVYNGKIYGMPMKFQVPVYCSREKMTSIELSTIVEKANSDNYMEPCSLESLLSRFLYTYYDEQFNEDGSIDKDALRAFYSNIQTLANEIELTKGRGESDGIDDSLNETMLKVFSTDCVNLLVSDNDMSMTYLNCKLALQIDVGCLQEVNGSMIPMNQTFVPYGIIGINQASKEKELAKDFIRSLYVEEFQGYDLQDGFPMNQTVLKQWMTYKESDNPSDDGLFQFDESVYTEEAVNKLNELFGSLAKPVNDNLTTHRILYDGGMAYLNGEKPLDEVVDEVEQKINLYLSE